MRTSSLLFILRMLLLNLTVYSIYGWIWSNIVQKEDQVLVLGISGTMGLISTVVTYIFYINNKQHA